MPFTLVFVGAGNTGRSVLAAAAAGRELHRVWPAADEVRIISCGLDVVAGMPIAPHAETVAARRGLDVGDHTAVPFSREVADAADLVLTMGRRQRAGVVLRFPRLRPRTFALLEYVDLLHGVESVRPNPASDRPSGRLRLVTSATAARRRTLPASGEDSPWDLFDPYAQSLDAYEQVAAIVDAAVHDLVTGVAGLAVAAPSAPSRSA